MAKRKEDDKPAKKGHNRVGGIESGKLRSYIERIENLNEDIAGLTSDRTDIFTEAKSNGFCTKTMREMIKLRKMKDNERSEAEYMRDLYARALGFEDWGDMEDRELD